MSWLSVDGGNEKKTGRACYVAGWLGRELRVVEAFNVEGAREFADRYADQGGATDFVCVERHQLDGRMMRGETTPAVMIDLAWNTAAVAYTLARGAPVHEYRVGEWIGGQNKVALHSGIWTELAPAEREIVARFGRSGAGRARGPAGSGTPADVKAAIVENAKRRAVGKDLLHHDWFDVLDAAGVGCFHLGRIGKGAAPVRRAGILRGSTP